MADPVGIPFRETQGAGNTSLATSARRGPSGRLLRLKPERREKPDLRVSIVPWIPLMLWWISESPFIAAGLAMKVRIIIPNAAAA